MFRVVHEAMKKVFARDHVARFVQLDLAHEMAQTLVLFKSLVLKIKCTNL